MVHVRERVAHRRRLERRMRAMTRQDIVEHARVAPVRDEREQTASSQHPLDLKARSLCLEPVERLRDCDGVREVIGQRDRLRGPGVHLDPLRDERTHLGQGLNGDDARTRRHELPRELPGAGCEIDDDKAGPESQPLDEELDRPRRVPGPRPFVGRRGPRERGRGS